MLLQEDVNHLVDWSRNCYMEFNEGKCKVMDIGRLKLVRTMITMERKSGERVEFFQGTKKDLVVVVNNKLKWDDQVNHPIIQEYVSLRNAQKNVCPLERLIACQVVHRVW